MPSTGLPDSFRRIELVADDPGGPLEANRPHRYSLVAPLDPDGALDVATWERHQQACEVIRRRCDRRDDVGHLVRTPMGVWAFRYDVCSEPGDSGSRPLEATRIGRDASILLTDEDGLRRLNVVSISPV